MLEKVGDFFEGQGTLEQAIAADQNKELTDHDVHVATAVLLVEMAGADRKIAPQEGRAVVAGMSRIFGLKEEEVPALVKLAIAARKEQGRLDQFMACISTKFDRTRRLQVLAVLWKVMMADGSIQNAEQQLMRRIKETLHICDEDIEEALRMAQFGEV